MTKKMLKERVDQSFRDHAIYQSLNPNGTLNIPEYGGIMNAFLLIRELWAEVQHLSYARDYTVGMLNDRETEIRELNKEISFLNEQKILNNNTIERLSKGELIENQREYIARISKDNIKLKDALLAIKAEIEETLKVREGE